MSSSKGNPINLGTLRRIYILASPYKWLFITTIFASVIIAGLSPLRALLTQITIDDYITKKDVAGLVKISLGVVCLLIFQSLIQFAQSYGAGYIGQGVIKELRVTIFKHIHAYKAKKLDQSAVGTLVTRNISDLETIAEVFSEGLVSIIADLLQIVFIIILMLYSSWQLTLVALSTMPLLLYAGYVFKNAVKASFIDTRNQITKLNTFVQEHIQGMQIVQIFNRNEQEYNKFVAINDAHRNAQNKGVFAYAVFFPVVEIITATSTALIIWYGMNDMGISTSGITPGILTSFLILINMFFRPIRQLADRFNTLQMGMVAAERIFALLDETDAKEIDGTLEKKIKGDIEFKEVHFSYNDNQPVLRGVSFKVAAGRSIAIVGATGAGKSSIINLVNRFYDINSGSILIDGAPVKEYKLQSLRQQIAIVQQDVFLFSGNIADNLTLFDKRITEEAYIRAAQMVGIDDFIQSLPEKYMTYVHERGATLSSGQRQLIAFARAILTTPAVLILDEATASVDSHAEALIQDAIALLMKDRTSIAIAHRLSTIEKADEILVLDKGEIVERGTHSQLLNHDGYYKKLYDMQLNKHDEATLSSLK